MRNRWLVNLLLLILVIVLGALMRSELERGRRAATLTGLLPERITEISLERSGLPAIRLSQGADGWRMESPHRVRANGSRIAELAGIATTPVYRSLPKSAAAQRLGLTADSPRLTLNGLVLHFGEVDPIGQHRYVGIGEQVHLIDDGFQHHLIAPAHAYVDRTLLPPEFRAHTGTLNGVTLSQAQLADLAGLKAQDVQPLGSELAGRLLSLSSEQDSKSLRFLVSDDGLSWARLDLRLRYLLQAAPAWALMELKPQTDTAKPPSRDLSF